MICAIITRIHEISVLAACRTLVVDSENRPRQPHFLPDLPPHSHSMGQKAGENGAAAVGLQPTIPKSDRLLDRKSQQDPALLRVKCLQHG
jgi:hypothetical protein